MFSGVQLLSKQLLGGGKNTELGITEDSLHVSFFIVQMSL